MITRQDYQHAILNFVDGVMREMRDATVEMNKARLDRERFHYFRGRVFAYEQMLDELSYVLAEIGDRQLVQKIVSRQQKNLQTAV